MSGLGLGLGEPVVVDEQRLVDFSVGFIPCCSAHDRVSLVENSWLMAAE